MHLTPQQRAILEDQDRWLQRGLALAAEVDAPTPWLALTIGQDMASAERATELVRAGLRPLSALVFIGSYGRMEWALDNLTERQLLLRICGLWSGSDPDDTNPRFAEMWRRLWWLRGHTPFLDGDPLPDGERLRIYRGQKPEAKVGIAWSMSEAVAEKFARGASERRADMGGVVLIQDIQREQIVAYLTKRGEQEVIWLG